MTLPDEDLPNVAKAAHEVAQEAKDAGAWIFGGGVESHRASDVATDGTVTDRPYPEARAVLGGFAIIEVSSREEALEWAALWRAAAGKRYGSSCPTRTSDRRTPEASAAGDARASDDGV